MNKLSIACGAAIAALALSATASAQTAADQQAVAYQAARNQLGILLYCTDKGFLTADVPEIQRKMIGMLPAPADKTGGDTAEASGRKGMISAMGVNQDLEAAAKAQGGSVQPLCTQIGAAVKQAGAMLPK